MAEEEDDNLTKANPKSMEDKFGEMERKYTDLKSEYLKALDKVKALEAIIRKEKNGGKGFCDFRR